MYGDLVSCFSQIRAGSRQMSASPKVKAAWGQSLGRAVAAQPKSKTTSQKTEEQV